MLDNVDDFSKLTLRVKSLQGEKALFCLLYPEYI